MLEYMKIMEGEIFHVLSTPSVINKIKSANYKEYMKEK